VFGRKLRSSSARTDADLLPDRAGEGADRDQARRHRLQGLDPERLTLTPQREDRVTTSTRADGRARTAPLWASPAWYRLSRAPIPVVRVPRKGRPAKEACDGRQTDPFPRRASPARGAGLRVEPDSLPSGSAGEPLTFPGLVHELSAPGGSWSSRTRSSRATSQGDWSGAGMGAGRLEIYAPRPASGHLNLDLAARPGANTPPRAHRLACRGRARLIGPQACPALMIARRCGPVPYLSRAGGLSPGPRRRLQVVAETGAGGRRLSRVHPSKTLPESTGTPEASCACCRPLRPRRTEQKLQVEEARSPRERGRLREIAVACRGRAHAARGGGTFGLHRALLRAQLGPPAAGI